MNFKVQVDHIHLGDFTLELNFSSDFHKGIYNITAPNGAGKSSLLKALAGVYPFEGFCRMDESLDLASNPIEYKKNIGFCADQYDFFSDITADQYLDLISKAYQTPKSDYIFFIEQFNADRYLKHTMASLSYGTIKKFLLASALGHKPAIILMDEPTNGLDKHSKAWLFDYLLNLPDSSIVIMVSHEVAWYKNLPILSIDLQT